MNPDPLYFEEVVPARNAGRSSFRWYLLASFVTGLLLGAAVARVVNL